MRNDHFSGRTAQLTFRCCIFFIYSTNIRTEYFNLPGWYLHLVVVGELEYPNDPESYAAGSVATGRVTLGGQVEG